jgi:hypothetical protein
MRLTPVSQRLAGHTDECSLDAEQAANLTDKIIPLGLPGQRARGLAHPIGRILEKMHGRCRGFADMMFLEVWRSSPVVASGAKASRARRGILPRSRPDSTMWMLRVVWSRYDRWSGVAYEVARCACRTGKTPRTAAYRDVLEGGPDMISVVRQHRR